VPTRMYYHPSAVVEVPDADVPQLLAYGWTQLAPGQEPPDVDYGGGSGGGGGSAAVDGPAVAKGRDHEFDPRTGTYNFTPSSFRRGRQTIARTRAGLGTCDITVYGDSRAQGATTSPQTGAWASSWPGRLRNRLTGTTQGGMLPLWDNIAEYDARFGTSGTWALIAGGPFDAAMQSTTAGNKTFTGTFDATVDRLAIYTLRVTTTGWQWQYSIDGAAPVVVGMTANRIGTTTWCRTVIPMTPGAHTVTISPVTATGATLYLGAVEETSSGTTGFRVHSLARAGYDYVRLLSTNSSGWKSLDTTWLWNAPDIGIVDLGINSYNNQRTLADFRTATQTIIDRIKATGDPVLVAPYDYASGPAQVIPLDDYIDVYYDLADTNNCPLIDLNWYFKADTLWPSNPSGYYNTDNIHFGNLGQAAHEIAVARALTLA
jgi:hypothetical protein